MVVGEEATAAGGSAEPACRWWERRWLLAFVVLATTAPLLYPPIPPLVDLLGHLGRFRVELDLGHSSSLQRFYDYHWAMIGNLGVDILIIPLSKLMGLELAVKLIVIAIPPLTATGFLWVAREIHGRLQPTVFVALPFVYGFPFLFGFVNFTLSVALAFLAFGLWLRLGRLGKMNLRTGLSAPIALIIFFCHVYGWALFGLLCFLAETVRLHDSGGSWLGSAGASVSRTMAMASPLIIMLIWRNQSHAGSTDHWFDFSAKIQWILSAVRDRWKWFDVASVILALIVIVEARRRDSLTFSRRLVLPALVLSVIFFALPLVITGSAYADMRFVPYIFALALLAIRFRPEQSAVRLDIIAGGALLFFFVRLLGTTASLAIASSEQESRLGALELMPKGARVATLVGSPCGFSWALPRGTHIGAMVIVRREGFSNDQWLLQGINLMSLKYGDVRLFAADPSELVRPSGCREGMAPWSLDEALKALPRNAFDFLWLIDPPQYDRHALLGMQPVWRGPGATLYRIPHQEPGVNRL